MKSTPLYMKIAQEILNQIESGKLMRGAAIPSEAQLQEQYGVSRVTVRKALSQLTEKGFLQKFPYRELYVKIPSQ